MNVAVGVAADVSQRYAVIGRLLDRASAGQWAEPELGEQDVLEDDMWG